jgi:hypothetical protein
MFRGCPLLQVEATGIEEEEELTVRFEKVFPVM